MLRFIWTIVSIYLLYFVFCFVFVPTRGAGRSSEVERSLMVRWVVGSILHGGGPIELFLVPATGVTKAVVCVILSVGWCI